MKKSNIYGLTVLVVAALGCSSLSDDADSKVVQAAQEPADCGEGEEGCGPGDVTMVECSDLGQAVCGEADGCIVILGRRAYESRCVAEDKDCWISYWGQTHWKEECVDPLQFVVCEDAGMESVEGRQYARNPQGEWWQFDDGFTPSGWEIGEPELPVTLSRELYPWDFPVSEECAQLGFDECVESADNYGPCAPIWGERVNELENDCTEERQYIECGPYSAPGLHSWARDPSGVLWAFWPSALPIGWPIEMLCTVTLPCGYVEPEYEEPEYVEYEADNPEEKGY